MNSTLLVHAFNAEKNLVHIDSVKNGIQCNCRCPGCNELLIAKNDGKIREHHFAHKSGSDCGTAYQTIMHIWAKELIVENQLIPIGNNGKKSLVKTGKIWQEINLTDLNIIPDVFAVVNCIFNSNGRKAFLDIPVIVEIFVTHQVDDKKAEIIRKAGIPAIEIDLSKSTAVTKEELKKDLYNIDNWYIINETIGKQYLPHISISVNQLLYAYKVAMSGYTYTQNFSKQYKGYSRRRR